MYDAIIIGGGPGGMTAAIYAGKREMKTLLIEKGLFGGYMLLTDKIENYPGFLKVSGSELSEKMEEQVRSLSVDIVSAEATKLHLEGNVKKVETTEGTYEGKAIILAVGGGHKKLEVKGEKEYTGRGVSYCSTCDAPFYKGRTVAIVGGGNSAISDALYLSDVAKKVHLIHRRESLRAEESRQAELRKRGVEILLNTGIDEIIGDKLVNAIQIRDLIDNQVKRLSVDGVFISIGTVPHSELAKDAGVKLDEKNFIKVDRNQETNVEGVFAGGDVVRGPSLVVHAVRDGRKAAVAIHRYLTP